MAADRYPLAELKDLPEDIRTAILAEIGRAHV